VRGEEGGKDGGEPGAAKLQSAQGVNNPQYTIIPIDVGLCQNARDSLYDTNGMI